MPPTPKKADTKTATTTTYRYVGDHAIVLEGGRPLGPGEFIDLSTEDLSQGLNKDLLESGMLLDTTAPPETEAATQEDEA